MQCTVNADVYAEDARNPSLLIIALTGGLMAYNSYHCSSFFKIDLFLVSYANYIIPKENFNFEIFCKKGFMEKFVKITGKYLCWRLFLNRISVLHRHVFSCEFCKIFQNIFLLKSSGGYFFQINPNLKKRRKNTLNSEMN